MPVETRSMRRKSDDAFRVEQDYNTISYINETSELQCMRMKIRMVGVIYGKNIPNDVYSMLDWMLVRRICGRRMDTDF